MKIPATFLLATTLTLSNEERTVTNLYDLQTDTPHDLGEIIGESATNSCHLHGWTPGGRLFVTISQGGPINPRIEFALIDLKSTNLK